MEDIIKQIIQIESEAQQIIDDAMVEKKKQEAEHEIKIKELREKIISDAHKKVESIKKREFAEIDEEEKAKAERCDEHILKIEAYAAEHIDEWVEDIVNRVLD